MNQVYSLYVSTKCQSFQQAVSHKPTKVFPVPLAPASDVISPYLNPPSRAFWSMVAEPELAGEGLAFSCALADASKLEPSKGGAACEAFDIVSTDSGENFGGVAGHCCLDVYGVVVIHASFP